MDFPKIPTQVEDYNSERVVMQWCLTSLEGNFRNQDVNILRKMMIHYISVTLSTGR